MPNISAEARPVGYRQKGCEALQRLDQSECFALVARSRAWLTTAGVMVGMIPGSPGIHGIGKRMTGNGRHGSIEMKHGSREMIRWALGKQKAKKAGGIARGKMYQMLNGKPMLSGKDGIGMDGGMTLLIRAGTGSGRMVAMIVRTSVADTRWVIRLLKSRNPR